MAHTTGPWNIAPTQMEPSWVDISGHGWFGFARVVVRMEGEPLDHAEGVANARLIAASPRLLAALKSVVRIADRATDEFDEARAAIAEAEGE